MTLGDMKQAVRRGSASWHHVQIEADGSIVGRPQIRFNKFPHGVVVLRPELPRLPTLERS